jgi:uncharacterized protein (UPF0332 family)
MSLDRLLKEGSIHVFEATRDEIDKAIEIARRDFAFAEKIFEENLDWCFSIGYNAVLQACRAYMFHLGYRPSNTEAHKATFEFMQYAVDEPFKKYIPYFDRARRKRHRTLYDEVGLITENEARELLKKAKEFLAHIENKLASGKSDTT